MSLQKWGYFMFMSTYPLRNYSGGPHALSKKKMIFPKNRSNLNSNPECNNKKPKKRRCILCRYNFVLLLLHFVHLKPKTLTELQIYSLMWYHMGPLGRTKKGKRNWQLKDHISMQNILFQNTSDSTYIQCNEYIRISEKMTNASLHFLLPFFLSEVGRKMLIMHFSIFSKKGCGVWKETNNWKCTMYLYVHELFGKTNKLNSHYTTMVAINTWTAAGPKCSSLDEN